MQLPLFPRRIVDDLGAIGGGVTAPRWVRADDGLGYVVKDDAPGVGAPTARASEFLWLSIAHVLGLPAPAPDIFLNNAGRTLVGTRREDTSLNAALQNQALLAGQLIQGGAQLSKIYAFDVFSANWDRNPGNYLVLQDGGGSMAVFAIDFSHVTPHPGLTPPQMDPLLGVANATRAFFPKVVQPYGADRDAAITIIDRLDSLPSDAINSILSRVPDDWLPQPAKDAVGAWWSSRARLDRTAAVKQGFQNGTLI
jgi:hypothetical protein